MEKFGTEKHMRVILGGKIRFEKDDCPFCHDIRDQQRVIWQNTNWAILLNKYPYTLDGKHTMLVPIRHITYTHEVT
jgi:diadenosine tetraphosphate (Ap4A) HIT family hydrolase